MNGLRESLRVCTCENIGKSIQKVNKSYDKGSQADYFKSQIP